MSKQLKLDAAQTAYFLKQLTHVESEVLRTEYPENRAKVLFPTRGTTPWTANKVEYRILNKVGNAALIMSYSKDLKKVQVFGRIETSDIRTIAASFEYDFLEIARAAAGVGINLPAEQAITAREMIELEMNELAFTGDADANLKGVLTHPNVIIQAAAPVGTGSSPKWADKTEAQIRADINTAINTIRVGSNGVENPDSIALPIEQEAILDQEMVGNAQDKSIREVVLKGNKNIKNIEWAHELKDVALPSGSPATGDVAIFYEKNPRKLVIDIPLMFKKMPPQATALVEEVPCVARFGGAVIKRPRSVLILEDI